MGCLPFLKGPWSVGVAAALANFSATTFNPTARDLLKRMCLPIQLKNHLAWLRAASNLGQVVSSGVAILAGKMGILVLLLFDSITSLIAFFVGWKTLPPDSKQIESTDSGQIKLQAISHGFYIYTFSMAGYFFIYELGFLSLSALSKIYFPDSGVAIFGMAMFINTLLCGTLSVVAANKLKNPRVWLPIGIIFTAFGPLMLYLFPKSIWVVVISAFFLTTGEILLAGFVQILLMQNSSGKLGVIHYGRSLMIQKMGNLLAGLILFPFIIHGNYPWLPITLALILCFSIYSFIPRTFFEKNHHPQ